MCLFDWQEAQALDAAFGRPGQRFSSEEGISAFSKSGDHIDIDHQEKL